MFRKYIDCFIICTAFEGCKDAIITCPSQNYLCDIHVSYVNMTVAGNAARNMTIHGGGGDLVFSCLGNWNCVQL